MEVRLPLTPISNSEPLGIPEAPSCWPPTKPSTVQAAGQLIRSFPPSLIHLFSTEEAQSQGQFCPSGDHSEEGEQMPTEWTAQ